MKSLKAAAVVTGSLIIAGAAAPAFAQNATEVVPKSLNNTLNTLDPVPVQVQSPKGDVLGVKEKEKALQTVGRTSAALGHGAPLLGGLSQQK